MCRALQARQLIILQKSTQQMFIALLSGPVSHDGSVRNCLTDGETQGAVHLPKGNRELAKRLLFLKRDILY